MNTLLLLLQSSPVVAPSDIYLIAGCTLFGVALVLLALEFVIPSAGLLSTLCVLSIATGVICFFVHSTLWGFASLAISLGGAPFAIGFAIKLWSATPLAQRAVLDAHVGEGNSPPSALPHNGAVAIARTALRPIGRVAIGDNSFEAIAEDGFIEAGSTVRVVGREGGTLRVRAMPAV